LISFSGTARLRGSQGTLRPISTRIPRRCLAYLPPMSNGARGKERGGRTSQTWRAEKPFYKGDPATMGSIKVQRREVGRLATRGLRPSLGRPEGRIEARRRMSSFAGSTPRQAVGRSQIIDYSS